MLSKLKQQALGWLTWIGMIVAAILVVEIGNWLPWLPAVQRYQDAHPQLEGALVGTTLGMILLGALLLWFTMFLVRVPDASGASDLQVTKTRDERTGPGDVLSGRQIEASFTDETRLWSLKRAFQTGEWWRTPRWRRMSLMLLGGFLVFYGLFGLLFLLFPPGVKFLLFLAVLYATIRAAYAFAIDRPAQL